MLHFHSKLSPGFILGDRYRIESRVGSGGMSYVYRAYDLKLPGKIWAVKESVATPELYDDVEEEASILITLNHTRLPRIVDFFSPDDDGYTFLVMDFVEGVTLDTYLRNLNGKLPERIIIALSVQICEGLQYLHSHEPPIIYRDLKPSNLMVNRDGDITFIDFGIARQYKEMQIEDTVQLGTVGFAAPEQYGGRQTDARSDLFSLGALISYLGGQTDLMKEGDRGQGMRSTLSPSLMSVIHKLMEQRPEDRFESAVDVKQCLMEMMERSRDPRGEGVRLVKPYIIALLGGSAGVGTTHTAITIANTLAQRFRRITIVEMEETSKAFLRIAQEEERRYKGEVKSSVVVKFELEGVKYWRRPLRAEMMSLMSGDNDVVILDLGANRNKEKFEEFVRADLSLLVGSGAIWKVEELESFILSTSSFAHQKWKYLIPLASAESIHQLRRRLQIQNIYSAPYELNPFEPSLETITMIEHICSPLLQLDQNKRKLWPNIRKWFLKGIS